MDNVVSAKRENDGCQCGSSDKNRSSASDLNSHAQRPGLHGLLPAAFSPTAPPIRRPTSERFEGRWAVFTAIFPKPKSTIRGRAASTYVPANPRTVDPDGRAPRRA